MSMMRFGLLFHDLAIRETRTVTIVRPSPIDDPMYLPPEEFGFDEWYCTEHKCDCRRVMINVLARDAKAHVATINHAFEPPTKDDVVKEQTFLDPLNTQSRRSPALLNLFLKVLSDDPAYRQRLLRHYRMFKNAVDDPAHPCQRLIRDPDDASIDSPITTTSRIIPPPPRRGKRKWR